MVVCPHHHHVAFGIHLTHFYTAFPPGGNDKFTMTTGSDIDLSLGDDDTTTGQRPEGAVSGTASGI